MRGRFVVVFGAMALLLAVSAAPAAASHSWGSYHWARTSNPFTVPLGDNVTNTSASNWEAALASAATDWTASSVLDSPVVAGLTTGRKCRPADGRIEVCNARYGRNGWLGLAQIWTSGNHIVKATAKMNDTYLDSFTYSATNKQHVMCQEIGHGYGLDHQDESGADLNTCMDYADAFDNPSPNAHDYEQLETIYGHTDTTSTVSSGAAMSGRVIHRRHGLHSSYIVEDLGNGLRRHTFIHWAIPGAQAAW
jgi:hypothetical protein